MGAVSLSLEVFTLTPSVAFSESATLRPSKTRALVYALYPGPSGLHIPADIRVLADEPALGYPACEWGLQRGGADARLARLLPGPGWGRRSPYRAGVRRGLHQPPEDSLRSELRPGGPRRGSPDPAGSRTHSVHVAASARAGHDTDRGRDSRGGACRLGMDRGHPVAAAQELGHHGTRPAQAFHTTRGGGTGRHAAVRGRWHLRAGRRSGRSVLAGGRHHLFDPRSSVRRVGAARGDQPVAEGGSRTTLAVGHRPFTLQELLQAEVALLESFRVLYSHKAVVPGFPLVAGLILFALGIGQNKPVLPGVLLEPPVGARLREKPPDLVGGGRVREVHCGTKLVLAVSRRRAHPTGTRPEDAHQPQVGELLILVGTVARSYHQLLSVYRGVAHQAPQMLGCLAP